MSSIHSFTHNLFSEHCYVVEGEKGRCVIIDPGCYSEDEKEELRSYIKDNGLKVEAILLTHGHVDHTFFVKGLLDLAGDIPVYMGSADRTFFLYNARMCGKLGLAIPDYGFRTDDAKDGMVISAAGLEFKVITTPGHSPGSVCYLIGDEGIMFTGDTLFAGTIGRTDLEYGDYDDEIRSIMEKLIWLDPAITIYPGHGQPSSIGVERSGNPFLEPFNEKEELE